MPRYDAETELNTLREELADALRRLYQSEEEAKPVIRRQISEIKRDIWRNSVILRATSENHAQRST